jgi:hypothetical protein
MKREYTSAEIEQKNIEIEQIRAANRPVKVKILLVGESRPADNTFFYIGDNTLLKHTQKVFRNLGHNTFSPEEFLTMFRRTGFYLDDLCLTPVNYLDNSKRIHERRAGVEDLGRRIKEYAPKGVICIMKGIEEQVKKSLKISGVVNPEQNFRCVPFPANHYQPDYERELEKVLVEWNCIK